MRMYLGPMSMNNAGKFSSFLPSFEQRGRNLPSKWIGRYSLVWLDDHPPHQIIPPRKLSRRGIVIFVLWMHHLSIA